MTVRYPDDLRCPETTGELTTFMNWLLIPTILLSGLLYIAGKRLAGRNMAAAIGLGAILAVPGLLMPLYYLHLFDSAAWYYEFRSWPYIELSAAGCGFLLGALATCSRKAAPIAFGWTALTVVLFIPYAKPIVRPLPASSYRNRWVDGVCLQSTPSSCGAASAATVLRSLGIHTTEKQMAQECFTCRGGTENWYLARALRRRGCQVRFRVEDGFLRDAKLPLIAGVRVRKFGHFIAILSEKDGVYRCADPLVGLQRVSASQIRNKFDFTGFALEVGPASK